MITRSLLIFTFKITIILWLFVNVAEAGDSSIKTTANDLPFQAHSFNDLDYAKKLMIKGTKYFKFDVSLANRHSCSTYSTWNNQGCFNSSLYADEICCIAMRGDAGSQPNFNYPFNTTQEFVNLLDNFLSLHPPKNNIFLVAIDFQFGFEFNNNLAQNFVYSLSLLLQKYSKLQIAVGTDFILEYDRVCRKTGLQSQIGQQACTNQRRAISNGRFFLQSGSSNPFDGRDYKQRYKNFNIIYKEIDHLCQQGFPLWINRHPNFPLIFWEPSNQQQIQESLAKLMSPSCQRQHNRTLSGIALACNIDPEMFQLFMKPIVHPGSWDIKIQKLWLQNATSVKLGRSFSLQQGRMIQRIVAFWTKQSMGRKVNYLNNLEIDQQILQVNLAKQVVIEEEALQIHGVNGTIITISKMEIKNAVKIKQYSANLELIRQTFVPNYVSSYSDADTLYILVTTSNPTYLNLYSTVRIDQVFPYRNAIYLPIDKINSLTSFYFRKNEQNDTLLLFGESLSTTWVIYLRNGNIQKIKTLTYGNKAIVALKQNGKILLLVQDSYCHSGLLLNNNAENKCQLHLSQQTSSLAALPGLINLMEGTEQNLIDFILEDNDKIVTACHPSLSFSKHLNGKQASLVSAWGFNFISTKYIPLKDQDLMISLFSGGSNYEVDRWNTTAFIIGALSASNGLAKRQLLLE